MVAVREGGERERGGDERERERGKKQRKGWDG